MSPRDAATSRSARVPEAPSCPRRAGRGGPALRPGRVPAPHLLRLRGSTKRPTTSSFSTRAPSSRRSSWASSSAALIVWSVVRYRALRRHTPPVPVPHPSRDHLYRRPGHHRARPLRLHRVHREPRRRREPHTRRQGQGHRVPVGLELRVPGQPHRHRRRPPSDPDPVGINGAQCAPAVDCLGPGLVVPAGETTRITLVSKTSSTASTCPSSTSAATPSPGSPTCSTSPCSTWASTGPSAPSSAGCTTRSCSSTSWPFPPAQFRAWLSSQRSSASTVSASALAPDPEGGSMTVLAERPVAHEHEHEHHEAHRPAEVAHEHRSQADRHELHGDLAGDVLPGRHHGACCSASSWRAPTARF